MRNHVSVARSERPLSPRVTVKLVMVTTARASPVYRGRGSRDPQPRSCERRGQSNPVRRTGRRGSFGTGPPPYDRRTNAFVLIFIYFPNRRLPLTNSTTYNARSKVTLIPSKSRKVFQHKKRPFLSRVIRRISNVSFFRRFMFHIND